MILLGIPRYFAKKTLVVSGCILLLMSGCGSQEVEEQKKADAFLTYTLEKELYSSDIELTGVVDASREAFVSAKGGGLISQLYVDVGDRVSSGTLLGKLSGDESLVNASTARMNEQDVLNAYESQKIFLDQQVENAKKALETAEAKVSVVKSSFLDTEKTSYEQQELSKKSVHQAEIALENVRNIANQQVETLYKNVPSSLRTALIAITNANDFADMILAVSSEKDQTNYRYEKQLGALDISTKHMAESALQNALSLERKLRIIYDENVEDQHPTHEEFDEYLETALLVLETVQESLKHLYTLLNNTTSSTNLSESTLQSWRQENLEHGKRIESAILSSSLDVSMGIKGLIVRREKMRIQHDAEITSAEAALLQAEQSFHQTKASSEQMVSGVDNEEIIAKKQVEQFRSALKSAEVQRDSVLKDLQTHVGVVKGNKKLSQVAVNNTHIISPFDGVITNKLSEVGQVVAAGEALFSVADTSAFQVTTDIPDVQVPHVFVGLPATVYIDGFDEAFSANISKMYPKVDPQTHKLTIELTLATKPKGITMGMFSRIVLHLPEKESYFLPKNFIHSSSNGPFIVTKDGKKIFITIGLERGDEVKVWWDGIVEGLKILETSAR